MNLNMHTLLVGSIHSHNLPAEGLQIYTLRPGQTFLDEFPSRH